MTMHHFRICADRETGHWLIDSAEYLGMIDPAEHYAKADTEDEHYDQHDGEALDRRIWSLACDTAPTGNVAFTVVWQDD